MQAGFFSEIITPQVGSQMEGYTPRISTSIHDDLYTSVVYIKNDSIKLLLITLDLIAIPQYRCDQIKRKLTERFSIQSTEIIISTIHTHSGPTVTDLLLDTPIIEPNYWNLIIKQTINAVHKSILNAVDSDLVLNKSILDPGVYCNRNNKNFNYNNNIIQLNFSHNDHMTGTILFLGTHPTVLNVKNTAISTDLVGEIRKQYFSKYGIHPIVMLTDCGDTSTRFTRKSSSFSEVQRLANLFLKSIDKNNILQKKINLQNYKNKVVQFSSDYNPVTNPLAVDFFHNLIQKCETASSIQETEKAQGFLNTYKHIRYYGHTHFSTESIIWDFSDLRIISYPGELVYYLGNQLRNFQDKPTILITLANDYRGYSVPQKDFGKYFESTNSVFLPGEADIFIGKIIKEIQK